MNRDVGVVVPAAGLGRRMGGVKKTFLAIGGAPVLLRSLDPFLDRPDVGAVCVALAPEDAASPPGWLVERDARVRVVPGGSTRSESVRAGLDALPDSISVVVVHDGARPLVTAGTVARCIEVAREGLGAVAGCRATDTMKEVDDEGRVVTTPERSRLWHAQTPQAFPRGVLLDAYSRSELFPRATDDASLVELAGHRVHMVESPAWNLKVTRPEDVEMAELIYRMRLG